MKASRGGFGGYRIFQIAIRDIQIGKQGTDCTECFCRGKRRGLSLTLVQEGSDSHSDIGWNGALCWHGSDHQVIPLPTRYRK
jgi:hypothetical protein